MANLTPISVRASTEAFDGHCAVPPPYVSSLSPFLTFNVPRSPDQNLNLPIPVRITSFRQTKWLNDRSYCIQNCVEICPKTTTKNGTLNSNRTKLVHLNARSFNNREHLTQIKELVKE